MSTAQEYVMSGSPWLNPRWAFGLSNWFDDLNLGFQNDLGIDGPADQTHRFSFLDEAERSIGLGLSDHDAWS